MLNNKYIIIFIIFFILILVLIYNSINKNNKEKFVPSNRYLINVKKIRIENMNGLFINQIKLYTLDENDNDVLIEDIIDNHNNDINIFQINSTKPYKSNIETPLTDDIIFSEQLKVFDNSSATSHYQNTFYQSSNTESLPHFYEIQFQHPIIISKIEYLMYGHLPSKVNSKIEITDNNGLIQKYNLVNSTFDNNLFTAKKTEGTDGYQGIDDADTFQKLKDAELESYKLESEQDPTKLLDISVRANVLLTKTLYINYNTINCEGSFSEFSECSNSCGDGTKFKEFNITKEALYDGTSCSYPDGYKEFVNCKIKECPINCEGSFIDLETCSKPCGTGEKTQAYNITKAAQYEGIECPNNHGDERKISCNSQPCPIDCKGNFISVSDCSAKCGYGFKTEQYNVTTQAQYGGIDCPHFNGYEKTLICKEQDCPIDCIGSFSDYTNCSTDCGGGLKIQTYNITQKSNIEGIDCPYDNYYAKNIPCNTQPCPTYPENTTIKEALKEQFTNLQDVRYDIIDKQEKLDSITNKFNILNKNISFLKNNTNYIPDDKTLTFY
jgi:hypothetical protein